MMCTWEKLNIAKANVIVDTEVPLKSPRVPLKIMKSLVIVTHSDSVIKGKSKEGCPKWDIARRSKCNPWLCISE